MTPRTGRIVPQPSPYWPCQSPVVIHGGKCLCPYCRILTDEYDHE